MLYELKLRKPVRPKVTKTIRKLKSISINHFNNDILSCSISSSSLSDRVHSFNTELESLLDRHAPLKKITVTQRDTPWYNHDIRHAKTKCRRLERKWRQSMLTVDHEIYKAQRNRLQQMREAAKKTYINEKLDNASSSKETYAVLNCIMHSKRKQNLPSHHDPRDLAESFSDFFFEKTSKIRKAIEDTPESNALLPPAMHCDASFERFEQTNVTEVAKLLSLTAKS